MLILLVIELLLLILSLLLLLAVVLLVLLLEMLLLLLEDDGCGTFVTFMVMSHSTESWQFSVSFVSSFQQMIFTKP